MASDMWISDFEESMNQSQNIMEMINDRNQQLRAGENAVKLNGKIRQQITILSRSISELRESLMKFVSSRRISQKEGERRQIMMDKLCSKETKIQQASRNEISASNKSALFTAGTKSGNPWDEEQTDVGNASIDDIRSKQQQLIREQDDGLGVLSQIVARQKNMALDIGNEVESQNLLIDDIHDHVDSTDQRINRETKNIKIVDRKASQSCWYWVVIILLLVAIIAIACVPGKN